MKNHISKLRIRKYKKSQFKIFFNTNTNTNTIIYLFIFIFNLILIPLFDDHPQILRKSGQGTHVV